MTAFQFVRKTKRNIALQSCGITAGRDSSSHSESLATLQEVIQINSAGTFGKRAHDFYRLIFKACFLGFKKIEKLC